MRLYPILTFSWTSKGYYGLIALIGSYMTCINQRISLKHSETLYTPLSQTPLYCTDFEGDPGYVLHT